MYHKQLITHIGQQRALGISDDDIRSDLKNEGWSKEDVDLSFYYVLHPEKMKNFSLQRILSSEVKGSVFIVTLLITVFTAGFAAFAYAGTQITNYTLISPPLPESGKLALDYGVQPAFSNPDFFNKVKSQFIEQKATFIEVDLTQMLVRVYKDGTTTIEVPVKTKGKSGSWWETPSGLYKIQTKEKTHYSSMGHVTQPWSMEFQGNFFIHGWPYHKDGTPVATTFSGGCIRLADEDAKQVYDTVIVGTPILVYEKDFSLDSYSYTEVMPESNAEAYLYADIDNNFAFLKKNPSQVLPAGPFTKLMTALVATEYINIEKTLTVPENALASTSVPRLTAKMKINVYQLLFPLLRESSNEAAEVIAQGYGRTSFIRHMNEKAKSIGMDHTVFVDPTGSSTENVSTTEDMFMLAKYIYKSRSFIFNITSEKVKTGTYGTSIFSDLGSANSLLKHDSFVGGVSDEPIGGSQYNLAIFELPIGSRTRPIFTVSFASDDAKGDINDALSYLLTHYK